MRNSAISILAITFLSCGCGTPSGVSSPTPAATTGATENSIVTEVNMLMERQQFDKAIEKAGEGLRQHPKSHLLYVNRGSLYVHTGEFEKARPDLQKALELSPEKMHWTLHLQLARCEYALGNLAQAEKEFAQAAQTMDKDPEPPVIFQEQLWRLRAENLASDRRHEQAIENFTKALKVQPDNMRALAGRALAYAALKDQANFQKDLKTVEENSPELAAKIKEEVQASSASPDSAAGLTAKGLSLMRSGDGQSAIAAFDQAIKKDPTYAQAYQKKGSVLQQLSKFEEAVECFSKSYQLASDEVSLFNRAVCYINLGDLAKAKVDLQQFVKVSNSPEMVEKAKSVLDKL